MNAMFWHSEWTIDDIKMTKRIISCIGKVRCILLSNSSFDGGHFLHIIMTHS
jgi:hypothetical protein